MAVTEPARKEPLAQVTSHGTRKLTKIEAMIFLGIEGNKKTGK